MTTTERSSRTQTIPDDIDAGGAAKRDGRGSANSRVRDSRARHVVLASGGLDSTVLVHCLGADADLVLISFNYGQRHVRELESVVELARVVNAEHHVVDLSGAASLLGASALTNSLVAVPDGYYTDESMRATVVPNRNAIMLDMAVALAITVRASTVAYGAHAGDHTIYPDCRPAFVEAYRQMVLVGNESALPDGFDIVAPFLGMSKSEIVSLGTELGVAFERTWSCYRGGERHCGTCGTCTERREAFECAGVADPTEYAWSDRSVV